VSIAFKQLEGVPSLPHFIMIPARQNKIDVSSLSEEDQKVFQRYGKLPSKRDILGQKLKERKYFDSGDYALSKAGKASDVGVTTIGLKHPLPENIPHSHNAAGTPSSSSSGVPVKESPLLHSSSDAGTQEPKEGDEQLANATAVPTSPVSPTQVPPRWVASSPDS